MFINKLECMIIILLAEYFSINEWFCWWKLTVIIFSQQSKNVPFTFNYQSLTHRMVDHLTLKIIKQFIIMWTEVCEGDINLWTCDEEYLIISKKVREKSLTVFLTQVWVHVMDWTVRVEEVMCLYLHNNEFWIGVLCVAQLLSKAQSDAALRRLAAVGPEVVQLWKHSKDIDGWHFL